MLTRVSSPKDFWTGLIYVALGLSALWFGRDYRFGTAGRMGPGYFRIRSLSLRFTGITHLYNAPTCSGRIVEKFEQDGEKRVKVAVRSANQYGEEKVIGEAVVALP